MIVHASEDIGNADPRALLVAVAAAQAVEHVGLPEARLNLAQAAIYLARAPKSNASYVRAERGDGRRARARAPRAAERAAGRGYPGAKKLGRGEGYVYPHDDPRGFDVDNLPDELKGRTYYRPSGNGEEAEGLTAALGERLKRISTFSPLTLRPRRISPRSRAPPFVGASSVRLNLHEWGDPAAPALVCLHGITAHGARFEQARARAARRAVPRARARPARARPLGLGAAVVARAAPRDLLDDGSRSSAPVGRHSFGGRLVLELAARHPDRMRAACCSTPRCGCRPAMRSSTRSRRAPTAGLRRGRGRGGAPRRRLDLRRPARAARGGLPRAPRRRRRRPAAPPLRPQRRRRGLGRDEPHAAATAAHGAAARRARRRGGDLPAGAARAYREVAGTLLETCELPGGHIVMWDALAETAAAIEGSWVRGSAPRARSRRAPPPASLSRSRGRAPGFTSTTSSESSGPTRRSAPARGAPPGS